MLTQEEHTSTITTRQQIHFLWSVMTLVTAITIKGEIEMETSVLTPRASRQTRQTQRVTSDKEQVYDDQEPIGMPTSSIRYNRSSTAPQKALPVAPVWDWNRFGYKCLQMSAVLLVVAFIADTIGYSAWKNMSDHLTYGDYPTAHLTANFGHSGPSHVVAFENGQYVDVIEVLGKNTANVYAVKVSSTQRRLVKLEVKDMNGDGKPDILVKVEGIDQEPCLLNTGKAFEWSVPR